MARDAFYKFFFVCLFTVDHLLKFFYLLSTHPHKPLLDESLPHCFGEKRSKNNFLHIAQKKQRMSCFCGKIWNLQPQTCFL